MEQDRKVKDRELGDRWAIARMLSQLLQRGLAVDLEEGVVLGEGMPRPCVRRRIRGRPNSSYFKPNGIRMIDLEESVLEMAEFEAIRFVDLKGVSQGEAGHKMGISQSTLSRVVESGRKKVADAIVNGKAIRICN